MGAPEHSCTPTTHDTYKRLSARLSHLGITRLADLTGLDRIGIPVVQAVRPLSLVNAVSQGKGLDILAAAVTAIMEAAEQHFSERLGHFETTVGSARSLGIPAEKFASYLLPDAPPDWISLHAAWVPATDLGSGRTEWVPFELVHCAYTEPSIPTDGIFLGSTTGLACAFGEDAALLHSLLECVERDAIARAQYTHGLFQKNRIETATIADTTLIEIVRRVNDAGCVVAFWSAPAAGNIPVIWCQIMEDGRQPTILPYPADGFAADLDPAGAAMQALLEAAQSRLATISGARDDITRSDLPNRIDWNSVAIHRQFLADGPRKVNFESLGEPIQGRSIDPLDRTLDLLASGGVNAVLSVRLPTEPCPEIVATRVLVPQLQPLREG